MDNQNQDSGASERLQPKSAAIQASFMHSPVAASECGQGRGPGGAGYWLKRFLACNPLYLVSAALLLYSFYLISTDQSFLSKETQQLSFNLCSLQVYEALLVATAVFLAWRAVWYDSILLVGLENLLLLVPFILISQAALIEPKLVWTLSAAAGLLAIGRLGALKRFLVRLNLPRIVLGTATLLIAVNAALPVVYRILHETKVGTRPDWGAAYETNQYIWWLLVPAFCAFFSIIPFSRTQPGQLWPERPWVPPMLFSLWLVGTGVHLYCLGYVYDFALRPELLGPAIWIISWVSLLRILKQLPGLRSNLRYGLLALPALATLLAAPQAEKGVFFALTLLNVAIYGTSYLKQKRGVLLHLALISVVALIGGMPGGWGTSIVPRLNREESLAGGAILYALGCILLSRNPKWGLFGAFLAAVSVGNFLDQPSAIHWAFQAGLVFMLLHSLRWQDSTEPGASAVRWAVAAIWVGHSFAWTHLYGAGWKTCLVGAAVVCVCILVRWLRGQWKPLVVPVAAVLVCFSVPGHSAAVHLGSAPAGLLAVLGSFLLFGLGTLAALTKHRWHTPSSDINGF